MILTTAFKTMVASEWVVFLFAVFAFVDDSFSLVTSSSLFLLLDILDLLLQQ
jgi:hypothetical protein